MNYKRDGELYRIEHYDGSLIASSIELFRMTVDEINNFANEMASLAEDLPIFLVGEKDGSQSYYECVYSDGTTRVFEE